MRAPLSKAPCSLLLAGLLCGILITVYASGAKAMLWSVAGGSLLLAALLAWRRQVLVAIAVAFIAIGAISTVNAVPVPPPESLTDGQVHTMKGCVLSVEGGKASQRAVVEITNAREGRVRPFLILMTVGNLTPTLSPSDVVELQCALQRVPFGNETDGVWELVPYAICYARGIGAKAFCHGEKIIVVGQSNSLRFLPAHISEGLVRAISHSGLSNQAQSLLIATVLGHRTELDTNIRESFSALGVAHVLCVSGYHVGLVAWLIIISFAPLRVFRKYGRWRNVLSALMVWLYVLICGAGPAAVRAGIMISIYLFAAIIEDDAQPFNSLCAAMIIILISNPFHLFTGGFLLSVCAVAGILLFAERLNPFVLREHRAHRAAEIILIPICAILGTLPGLLYMFHRFPLYFLPSNVVVALTFPLFLLLACGAIVLWQLGLRAAWVSAPANFIADGATWVCSQIAGPSATLDDIYISDTGIWLSAVALAIFALALRIRGRRRRLSLYLAATLCAAMGAAMPVRPPHGAWLYAWTERGKTFAALQTGTVVKVFSEKGVAPGERAVDFMKRRGAKSISTAGRCGLPQNIVAIKASETRPIDELITARTRFALLSSEMPAPIRKKFCDSFEAKGICCRELRSGTIISLRKP